MQIPPLDLVDWRGELFFVDIDHNGVYHKYNSGLIEKADAVFNNLIVKTLDLPDLIILWMYSLAIIK